MLPQALLRVSTRVEGDRIVPHYFTARDEPWLRSLIDECARFVGRKRSELHERLREPLAYTRSKGEAPDRDSRSGCALSRANGFGGAAEGGAGLQCSERHAATRAPRAAVVTRVAESFGVTAVELESALFADLRGERRVAELPKSVSPLAACDSTRTSRSSARSSGAQRTFEFPFGATLVLSFVTPVSWA